MVPRRTFDILIKRLNKSEMKAFIEKEVTSFGRVAFSYSAVPPPFDI